MHGIPGFAVDYHILFQNTFKLKPEVLRNLDTPLVMLIAAQFYF